MGLALDESNAVAHALLGALQHQSEHDWPPARRSFERAIELAPQMAFVHAAFGRHLTAYGLVLDAERELLHARHLDPHYLNTRLHMVNLRRRQRRVADAQLEIEAAEDLAPQNMAIVGMRGLLALMQGDAAAAIGHYQRCCELAPQGRAGEVAAADATMAALDGQVLSACVQAIVATRCGRHGPALALLARAAQERDPYLIDLTGEPSFEALHAEAGWADLLAGLRPQLLG